MWLSFLVHSLWGYKFYYWVVVSCLMCTPAYEDLNIKNAVHRHVLVRARTYVRPTESSIETQEETSSPFIRHTQLARRRQTTTRYKKKNVGDPLKPHGTKKTHKPGQIKSPEREKSRRYKRILLAHNLTDDKWGVPKNSIYDRLIYGAEKCMEKGRRRDGW